MTEAEKAIAAVPDAIAKRKSTIKCPHCEKEFGVNLAALYQNNTLTMTLQMKQGHRLQISTLTGVMSSMDKLLKAAARTLRVRLEVMVGDIRVTESKIEIDFMNVALPKVRE